MEGVAEDGLSVSIGEVEEQEGDALFECGHALCGEEEFDRPRVPWARGCCGWRGWDLLVLLLYLLDGCGGLEGLGLRLWL